MRGAAWRRVGGGLVACAVAASPLVAGCGDGPAPSDKPAGVYGPLGRRSDLPVDTRIAIDHLTAPVDIVRDTYGRPHIYAANLADAIRVEGYLVASDRTAQLELLRRAAEGRLAEVFAKLQPSIIDSDIAQRHIGLARVAAEQYGVMPNGERALLEAYADGVSQLFRAIRSGTRSLPHGVTLLPAAAFTDWTPVDSLALARFESFLLSYEGDDDIEFQTFLDAARATFTPADPNPAIAARSGIERDLLRFAPPSTATTTSGYPISSSAMRSGVPAPPNARAGAERAARLAATAPYRRALRAVRDLVAPFGFGSNDFAVAASRSATGHALVASDPHLSLSAPAVFWPVSLHVAAADASTPSLDTGGISFPGIPGIILGHNAHIAWGATVAGYDVTDVYDEQLTPDGSAVVFEGKTVPIETIDEVIGIAGSAPYVYRVRVVPHHGPIVPTVTKNHTVLDPDPTTGALSVRWTGLDASDEFGAILGLVSAKNVDEARSALNGFEVGAQNWMIGDDLGDILWTTHARVPIRDPRAFAWNATTYEGTLPCGVLPGDGTAEWTGNLPDALVPWEKNPTSGTLATANNDPIGGTLDNDPSNDTLPDGSPMFLQCFYDDGFRESRIQTRLAQQQPLSPDDLASIQGDVRSPLGAALAPVIVDAINRAEAERTNPGSHPDLASIVHDPAYESAAMKLVRDVLVGWGKEADYAAMSGVDPDTNMPLPGEAGTPTAVEALASQAAALFNAWFVRVIERTLGDELAAMQVTTVPRGDIARAVLHLFRAYPPTLATYDASTRDSVLWDDLATPAVETRDERVLRALLDALALLKDRLGPDVATYRWGSLHTVRFDALVPLWGSLSIPPTGDATFPKGFPRHGDTSVVDASGYELTVPLSSAPTFSYGHGPTQRFVADLDPAGPKAQNALPGGNVWDATSPHFRDEAEYWRKNETHPVPFQLADVIAAKESRTVAATP